MMTIRCPCPSLTVAVGLVVALAGCGGSQRPDVPDVEDYPLLRAGQPLFNGSADMVTAVVGPPVSSGWVAEYNWFCSTDFFGHPPEASFQGSAASRWRAVPGTSRDALIEQISELWRAEGLDVSRNANEDGEPFITAHGNGFTITAAQYGGTFTIDVLTPCYTWEELRASPGQDNFELASMDARARPPHWEPAKRHEPDDASPIGAARKGGSGRVLVGVDGLEPPTSSL
jgi:hypothetical protein